MSAESSPKTLERRALAAVVAAVGCAVTLAVMAADRSFSWGPYLGVAGVVAAALGMLDLVGAFEPAEDDAAPSRTLAEIARPLGALIASVLLFAVAARLATAGLLGVLPAAVVMPASFLAVLVAVHRVGAALGGPSRLLSRRGFWVVGAATLLYLPLLGSTSLIDPWESHYGEVAREMISRDDWISPWWAQERWFWSKPVLDLWLEALSMRLTGVHAAAGAMLAPLGGVTPRPEWALRLPTFGFAVTGLYFLYKGVARTFGERAGVLTALVLATMPQFFMMARQATTDMPLVGSLSAALGLLLLGGSVDPDRPAPSVAVRVGSRVVVLGAVHLVLAGAVLAVLPQILYLASRYLTLRTGGGFSLGVHADVFWSGSTGNCDVARQRPLRAARAPLRAAPSGLAGADLGGGAGLRARRQRPRAAARARGVPGGVPLRGGRHHGQGPGRRGAPRGRVPGGAPRERPPPAPGALPHRQRGGAGAGGDAALVRGDVRPARAGVHRRAGLQAHGEPRHQPPARHQRHRRRELPLLPVAARLRDLRLGGARARGLRVLARAGAGDGGARLAAAARRAGAGAPLAGAGVRPLHGHADQVPPLHLPGPPGAGGAFGLAAGWPRRGRRAPAGVPAARRGRGGGAGRRRAGAAHRAGPRAHGRDGRGAAPQPRHLQLRAALSRQRRGGPGAGGVRPGVRRDPFGDGGAAAAARGDVRAAGGGRAVRGVGARRVPGARRSALGAARARSRRTTGGGRARRIPSPRTT